MRHWDFLNSSIETGRISHAYIFSGNDKVEKESVATSLVQRLNCTKICSNCDICISITKEQYPDVRVVRSLEGKEIKIGEIRDLIASFQLGAWNSEWRIAVIHDAHLMNQEAQSAFLKLLEEPRGNALFLLLTEYPALLLETIRSRTQELNFYSFDSAESNNELDLISREPIAKRFIRAKELSESAQQAKQTMLEWTKDARLLMLKEIEQTGAPGKWRDVVQSAEQTREILDNTNVSTRIALEQFMIAL